MAAIARFLFIWMVIQVTEVFCGRSADSPLMSPYTFRCSNGKYIDNRWFCDGDITDCGDLSDETFGCDKQTCGDASFECYGDGICLDITSRCNTIKECRDGSDELNCGDETDIGNCTLQKGKYLCDDKMKCLDFKYTCDGMCNCLDCSDESTHCKKFDSHLCKSCPNYCLPTPKGTKCVCNSDDYETNKLCREIENCTGSLACSQYCSRYKNVTRCLCFEDHHEIPDVNGVKCRSNMWLENILLYSTATKIKMVNMSTNARVEIIQKEVKCTILTAAENYLYYATHRDNKEIIFKTVISDRKTEKVIELDSAIKSLAVDWISNNIYFTSNKSLLVCSSDGGICTQLKCCVVDVVALAPRFGWMFYTQNMVGEIERLIMKSNMDGSEETTLLDVRFHNSISLAVDEWIEVVYWLETESPMLHSVSLNGLNEREYVILENGLSSQFCALERHLFFMKKHINKILIAENMNFSDFKVHKDEDTNTIRNLFAYNPSIQLSHKIENPCSNSSCKNLCLLRSTAYTNGLNYSCICENFTSIDDNPWCDGIFSRPILKRKSSSEWKILIDSSTTPSLENDAIISTKNSIIFTTPPLTAELSLWERYPSVEIFNIMSCLAFGFSILTLFLSIRNSLKNKPRQNVNIMDQIEL